jgi:hypothetical protein
MDGPRRIRNSDAAGEGRATVVQPGGYRPDPELVEVQYRP